MDSGGPVFVPAALIGRLLGAINRWAAIGETHGHTFNICTLATEKLPASAFL